MTPRSPCSVLADLQDPGLPSFKKPSQSFSEEGGTHPEVGLLHFRECLIQLDKTPLGSRFEHADRADDQQTPVGGGFSATPFVDDNAVCSQFSYKCDRGGFASVEALVLFGGSSRANLEPGRRGSDEGLDRRWTLR